MNHKDLGLQDVNTREQSNETGEACFEYRMERLGRQTTHYIKSDSTQFYFVRRPGQTEDQMRELGKWITETLNFRTVMDDKPLPELLKIQR